MATKKSTNVYIILTQGQGDTFVRIVDKETWDWIFSGWHPPSPGLSSYNDTSCPPEVLKRYRQEHDEDEFPHVTRGSYENDRALQSEPVHGDTFFSLAEAMRFIKKRKLNVIDSYEGMVY